MSRYTYNAGLVTQTLDKLSAACNSIKNTNVDMQKGISTIYNARGAELMEVDFSYITDYQSQVTEFIDLMSTELRNKATEIEEYQNAPWYKKVFATIGLGALKLVEGIATFGENIGDGLVSIVGFIGGIFSSDFQDSIAEYVEKDYVGDYFAEQYEEGNLQWLNKYSVMSHTSTAANVLKGVGSALPVIIASAAITAVTGGGAAPLLISAGMVLVQGIGSGTQSGLQAGNSFNQAFGQGVKEGAVAAATTIVLGGVADKLGKVGKGVASGLDEFATGANKVANGANNAITAGTKTGTKLLSGTIDDTIQMGDDLINSLDDTTRSMLAEGGDTLKIIGKTTDKYDNVVYILENSNGTKSFVDSALGVAHMGDDVDDLINAAKAAGVYDDLGNAANNTINISNTATKVGSDAAAAIDDGKNVLQRAASKVSSKVDNAITNFGTNTKVGKTMVEVTKKIGPTGTNTIAATAGVANTHPIADSMATTAHRVAQNAQPTPGQQLIEVANTSSTNSTPTVATAEQAAANLQGLKDSGYQTGDTTGTTATPNAGKSTGGATTSTGSGSGYSSGSSSYTNTTPTTSKVEVAKPDFSTGSSITTSGTQSNTQNSVGAGTTSSTPSYQQSTNDIINSTSTGITPGAGTSGSSSPIVGNLTQGTSLSEEALASTDSSTVSEGVLNSLGDVSGSLTGITSENRTNIPTSSSPILTSEVKSSSSMIPLGAGLGAAAAAGIGAKAYMDKRENSKKENDDSLDTEEWEEDVDSLNIDYEDNASREEADYLSPTDEYAFQE